MTLNLKMPEIKELKPKITVFGVGGAGGNAVNNMIRSGLEGCEFVVANTDSQALTSSRAERLIQMGVAVTEGLGAGSQPDIGRAAAEEAIGEITDHLGGSHMVFVTAGMGGGTGTGAAPIIARLARDQGILTVGVVTKPFQFEGVRRMRVADAGIKELEQCVDTLIVIPNQNLFRIANEKTTFADAFAMADQVLYSGVACITDLMVKEGLINLDFADVRSVMREMGKAMMGTGEASGERRAREAAEAAIANPLLDETSMKGAKGLLISITGGKDLTLFEVDEAATRIREEVDPDANIILGATFEEELEGIVRVSVVATGIENAHQAGASAPALEAKAAEQLSQRLRGAIPRPATQPQPQQQHQQPQHQPQHQAMSQPAAQPTAQQAIQTPIHTRPAAAPPQPMARPAPAAQTPPAASFDHPDMDFDLGDISQHQSIDDGEAEEPFIPPVAEAPTRIPRVEDFPPVVQRQIEARQQPAHEDRGPIGLLRRLASVGLGRREEDPASQRNNVTPPLQRPAARPAAQVQQRQTPPQPRAAQPAPRGQGKDALYRPAQGDLDPHGRATPNQSRAADDELEIPAFLRRQAN
jgi:cell division protein FtsZ